jgi:hypothetical protein
MTKVLSGASRIAEVQLARISLTRGDLLDMESAAARIVERIWHIADDSLCLEHISTRAGPGSLEIGIYSSVATAAQALENAERIGRVLNREFVDSTMWTTEITMLRISKP